MGMRGVLVVIVVGCEVCGKGGGGGWCVRLVVVRFGKN